MNISSVTEFQNSLRLFSCGQCFQSGGLGLMQKTPVDWMITRDLKNKAMHKSKSEPVKQDKCD